MECCPQLWEPHIDNYSSQAPYFVWTPVTGAYLSI